MNLRELYEKYPYLVQHNMDKVRLGNIPYAGMYDPSQDVIALKSDLPQEERASVTGHEMGHRELHTSPTWSKVVNKLTETTPATDKTLEPYLTLPQRLAVVGAQIVGHPEWYPMKNYPREQAIDEVFTRYLNPVITPQNSWDEDIVRRPKTYMTGEQAALAEHARRQFKAGPQALWSGMAGNPEQGHAFRYLQNRIMKEGSDKTLRERIALEKEGGYDLAGYMRKYGFPTEYFEGKGAHLPDEFKLPNHITFSTDSIYSTPETPGGTWAQDADEVWHYRPSDFVLSMHPKEELQEYFAKYAPNDVLELPEETVMTENGSRREYEEDETTKDLYNSPRWRDIVR